MSKQSARPPLVLVSPSTDKKGAEFYDYAINVSEAYPDALLAAGAIPLIGPCAKGSEWVSEAVARADGVMLTGGDDLQPSLYAKGIPRKLAKTVGDTDPRRDFVELRMIQEAFAQRKPLLAICRGHQLLNVALGGTLYIDIPSQAPSDVNHSRLDQKDKLVHSIDVKEGTILEKIFGGQSGQVNSSHHQAVHRVAKGLKVAATAGDGIVEALEASDPQMLPFLLSVQFHPERLAPRYPEHLQIFRRFTQACADARPRSV